MGRANTSSVDTTKGDRIAQKMNVFKNNLKAGFAPDAADKKEQRCEFRSSKSKEKEKCKTGKSCKEKE